MKFEVAAILLKSTKDLQELLDAGGFNEVDLMERLPFYRVPDGLDLSDHDFLTLDADIGADIESLFGYLITVMFQSDGDCIFLYDDEMLYCYTEVREQS